jgi:hypothetical protein
MINHRFSSSPATSERTHAMNSTKTQKHGPVHTYWLYSDGGGKLGPFTKSEARAVVQENPMTRFRARRDGEVEWKDAAVRLAPKKSTRGLLWISVLAVLTLSVLGAWWFAHQNHGRIRGAASLPRTEGQSAEAHTPIAEKSPEGNTVGGGPDPVANLSR